MNSEREQAKTAAPVARDSWRRMMKEGKYRALRNIPVGWVLQILHSTDRTERWIRILTEIAAVLILVGLLCLQEWCTSVFAAVAGSMIAVHSVSWLLIGNFWVYMLDSFQRVGNPGIEEVMRFVDTCRDVFLATDSSDAILIYGSMCRSMFHNRSDLDLRVLRRPGVWNGLKAVYSAMYVKAIAFFRLVPVDLQVVDSMAFLYNQMRDDEHPIVVYERRRGIVANRGLAYDTVVENPSSVLRDRS